MHQLPVRDQGALLMELHPKEERREAFLRMFTILDISAFFPHRNANHPLLHLLFHHLIHSHLTIAKHSESTFQSRTHWKQ